MPRSNRRARTGWLDVLSLLPWWACLVLAVLSYLFLPWLAGERPDPQLAGNQPVQFILGLFWRALAIFGQYAFPFLFVIAGLMSGVRAMRRRASTPVPRYEPRRQLPQPAPSEPERGRLLKALDWKRFEQVCAGYIVPSLPSGTPRTASRAVPDLDGP